MVATGREARTAIVRVERSGLLVSRKEPATVEKSQAFGRTVTFVGEVGVELTHRILDPVASKEHDVLEKRVRITHDTGGILDIAGRVGQNRTVRPLANRLPGRADQADF